MFRSQDDATETCVRSYDDNFPYSIKSQGCVQKESTTSKFAYDRRCEEDQNNDKFIAVVLQHLEKNYKICKLYIDDKKLSHHTLQKT